MRQKIAILSGSFNPIHIGHIAIANYVAEFTDVNELWFVVSPQNPLKQTAGLLSGEHRLKMLELAIANLSLPFKVCNIEFNMPKPSYTIDTLKALNSTYPDCEFTLVMGADNIADIERWKDYKKILSNYKVLVYPRIGFDTELLCNKYGTTYIAAPIMEISATFIRSAITNNQNIEAFLPCGVYQYIKQHKLYI